MKETKLKALGKQIDTTKPLQDYLYKFSAEADQKKMPLRKSSLLDREQELIMECGIAFRENELKCVQKGLSDKVNRRIDMVTTKRNRFIDISHLIKQKDPLTT